VKVQSRKNENKKRKKSKKVKNEIRAKRRTEMNTRDQTIDVTDLTASFYEEECAIEDRDETVHKKSVFDGTKKTTKKNKKVTDEVKSLKGEVRKRDPPVGGSNIGAGFEESCSAQQRVVKCSKGINLDIHLPARMRLQGEGERSERSDECGRVNESMELQLLPSAMSVQLSIRCDTTAAENDDVANAAVKSEVRSPSDVAWTSTVNHVGTGDITLRSSLPLCSTTPQSSVGNSPAAEIAHHQTSKFNYDCDSAVPADSHADHREPCQGHSDTAENRQDQELRRNAERHHSPGSVDLSELCRVLRELNIKLERHIGANVQSKPDKEKTRENAVEDGVKQLKSLMASDVVNAAETRGASKIDGVASNRVISARGSELLRACRGVSNSLSTCKPSHTEQHPTPTTDTSGPSSVQFVPSEFRRDEMSDVQELVHRLTIKANEAEQRVNRLERDVMMMSGTGNKKTTNDQEQDHTGMLPAITGGNSDASCSLQYGRERTRSPCSGVRDDGTTDTGGIIETETGQF